MTPQPGAVGIEELLRGRRPRLRHLWIAGAALYVAAILYIGWQSIGEALAQIDPRILLVLMAVEACGLWLRACKWRLVLGPDNSAGSLFFLSKAAGGWSPGRIGELAPLLLRKHRTPRMAAWIIVDRLLEIAATLGLGLVGVLGLRMAPRGMAVMVCVALAVLVAAPAFVLTRRDLFLWTAQRTREGSVIHQLSMLVAAMSDEIFRLGRVLPLASTMTLAATGIDICVSILLYLSFGHGVGFFLLATVQCAHGLASAFPLTPNATGVPYLVAAGLLYTMGGVPKEVLAAAVGLRMVAVNVVFWTSFGLVGAVKLREHAG